MSSSNISKPPPPMVKDHNRTLSVNSGFNFEKLKEFKKITSLLDLEIENMGKGLKLRREVLKTVINEDYFSIVWREIEILRKKYLQKIIHRNHVAQKLLKEMDTDNNHDDRVIIPFPSG